VVVGCSQFSSSDNVSIKISRSNFTSTTIGIDSDATSSTWRSLRKSRCGSLASEHRRDKSAHHELLLYYLRLRHAGHSSLSQGSRPSTAPRRHRFCQSRLVRVQDCCISNILEHIEGTINDAAKVPEPSPSHGSYHWSFERAISVAMIPLTIAPFAAGHVNPLLDSILCAALVLHSHIGFE
jgi:hypothetical protein